MLSLRSTLCLVRAGGVRVNPSASIMWPTKFEDPLKNREEIRKIQKTPEYERKVNVPVKAALQDASCSMLLDPLLQKFVKIVTEHSNGQLGEKIWIETCRRIKEIQLAKYYDATDDKRGDIELNPRVIVRGAIENCRPLMSLQKVKVGSVTYYVPTPITENRSYFEACRWIHRAGRWDRDTPAPGKKMIAHKGVKPKIHLWDGLAKECVDAFNGTGRAINTLYEHHKTCEQNRAYAHYRRTK